MRPVSYARATDTAAAIAFALGDPHAEFIAGGTNVVDLMKDDVARPSTLVDITRLPLGGITPKMAIGHLRGVIQNLENGAARAASIDAPPAVK